MKDQQPEARVAGDIVAAIQGRSAVTRRLRDRLRALAPLNVPVFVSGEPGVGHDHVVHCLHTSGATKNESLVTVTNLEAGSQFPASARAFYLDEVGRFAPADQLHWCERLREQERRPGGEKFRVFASSSEDIASRVRAGSFHPRLARLLLRFPVPIAPLRDRPEDIGPIVLALAERFGSQMGRERVRFDRAAIALLRSRTWPGNVRELALVVEKLVAFSPGGSVTRDRVREVLGEALDSVASLRTRRNEREREELMAQLECCGGNLAEVARRLDVSRGAVIYRAQKHGLLPRP
jgi:DNA-binding NtrC family response regulator